MSAERCTCGQTACESDLCNCDSRPCPVDHAREERYAARMAGFLGHIPEDGPIPDVFLATAREVMALADDEIAAARAEVLLEAAGEAITFSADTESASTWETVGHWLSRKAEGGEAS